MICCEAYFETHLKICSFQTHWRSSAERKNRDILFADDCTGDAALRSDADGRVTAAQPMYRPLVVKVEPAIVAEYETTFYLLTHLNLFKRFIILRLIFICKYFRARKVNN